MDNLLSALTLPAVASTSDDVPTSNSALVRSLVLNGDGAHAPRTLKLLSTLVNLQKITFFDFELYDDRRQDELCAAIPLAKLERASFHVLPARFTMEGLKRCAPVLKDLHFYRVDLGERGLSLLDTDGKGGNADQEKAFPKLERLELWHPGDMPLDLFSALVLSNASRLRQLKICLERYAAFSLGVHALFSGPVQVPCFVSLEELELRCFPDTIVVAILRGIQESQTFQLRKLVLEGIKHIRLPSQQRSAVPVQEDDWHAVAPDASSENALLDRSDALLDYLPASLTHLELCAIAGRNLAYRMSYYLFPQAGQSNVLPALARAPTVTLAPGALGSGEQEECKRAYINAVQMRRWKMTEEQEQECYSVVGVAVNRARSQS